MTDATTSTDNRSDDNWVLVSDGANAGTRDSVVTIRALARGGYRIAVTVRSERAVLSRYVDRRVAVDGREIGDLIRWEMSRGDYCAFIPASENVVLSMETPVPGLLDKVTVSRRAREVGLSVPEEMVFESPSDLAASASILPYPVVVKPATRTFNAVRADDASQLRAVPRDSGELIVQPFLAGPMTAIAGVMWDSRIHSSVTERWERIWPADCGLAAWAVSIPRSERHQAALAELMSGYSGLFVAQFVADRLIDLNLRAHSSLPLAVHAGANLAAIYADLSRGLSPPPAHAEPGHTFRWISGDVKRAVHSMRSGSTSISRALKTLSPVRGTAHSMFYWRDPAPMLARLASRFQGSR